MSWTNNCISHPLRRRLLPETDARLLPQLIDRTVSVHCANNCIARRRQAMHPAGDVIVHDVPDVAAIAMPMDSGMLAQLWL